MTKLSCWNLDFPSLATLFATFDKALQRSFSYIAQWDSLRVSELHVQIKGPDSYFLNSVRSVRRLEFDSSAELRFRLDEIASRLNPLHIRIESRHLIQGWILKSFPTTLLGLELFKPKSLEILADVFDRFPCLTSLRLELPDEAPRDFDPRAMVIPNSLTFLHLSTLTFPPIMNLRHCIASSSVSELIIEDSFIPAIEEDDTLSLRHLLPIGIEKLTLNELYSAWPVSRRFQLTDFPSSLAELTYHMYFPHLPVFSQFSACKLKSLNIRFAHRRMNASMDAQYCKTPFPFGDLPRSLTSLRLDGAGFKYLEEHEIDNLPSSLTSLHTAFFRLELVGYFRNRFPGCFLDITQPIHFEDVQYVWESILSNESSHFDLSELLHRIRTHFFIKRVSFKLSVLSLGCWPLAKSCTIVYEPDSKMKSFLVNSDTIYSVFSRDCAKAFYNLKSLDIDLPSAGSTTISLSALPSGLTSLDLHSTPVILSTLYMPSGLTSIKSLAELDLCSPVGDIKLPPFQHLDAPFWSFSADSISLIGLQGMSCFRARIIGLADYNILDFLTKKVDSKTRSCMDLSIVYVPTGSIIQLDRDNSSNNATITWDLLVASTTRILYQLLADPFSGPEDMIGRVVSSLKAHSENIRVFIPSSATKVTLNPGTYLTLTADGLTLPTSPTTLLRPNVLHTRLYTPDSFFFSNHSPLRHLELVGVAVSADWWTSLPNNLEVLLISTSSSFSTNYAHLPSQLRTFVYFCNSNRAMGPVALPLSSLPTHLADFVLTPQTLDLGGAQPSMESLTLPNLKSFRLGPTPASVVSLLIRLLPMSTMEHLEVERVIESPSTQNHKIDFAYGKPSPPPLPYPSLNGKIVVSDFLDFSDVWDLPRVRPSQPHHFSPSNPTTASNHLYGTEFASEEMFDYRLVKARDKKKQKRFGIS